MYCLSLLQGSHLNNGIIFFFPIEIEHRQYIIVIVIVIQHVYVSAFDELLASLPPTVQHSCIVL